MFAAVNTKQVCRAIKSYMPLNLSLVHLPDLFVHQFAVSPCPSLASTINR